MNTKVAYISKIVKAARYVLSSRNLKTASSYVPGIDDGQFDNQELPEEGKSVLREYLKTIRRDLDSIQDSTDSYSSSNIESLVNSGYSGLRNHLGDSGLDVVAQLFPNQKIPDTTLDAYKKLLNYYNTKIYPQTEDYKQEPSHWDTWGHGEK